MRLTKHILPFFVLCFITPSLAKPSDYLTEGRGIGSTLWGWITYPFSWWSSGEPENLPANDQLIGTPIYGPYDNIEIAKRNVTVWCNDQTCTTMKCDKFGCKNVTCNIYDTDMRGECREYNTVVTPEEPITSKPTPPVTETTSHHSTPETTQKPEISTSHHSTPETTQKPEISSTDKEITVNQPTEERPIELEAVISSTVHELSSDKGSPEKIDQTESPQNKI